MNFFSNISYIHPYSINQCFWQWLIFSWWNRISLLKIIITFIIVITFIFKFIIRTIISIITLSVLCIIIFFHTTTRSLSIIFMHILMIIFVFTPCTTFLYLFGMKIIFIFIMLYVLFFLCFYTYTSTNFILFIFISY